LLLVVAVGCANYTEPVVAESEMTAEQQRIERLWKSSRDVLRAYRFELDRTDRRAGILVTEPMTAQVLGEFWRKDAATGRDLAEGSLHTIYRQARVFIESAEAQEFNVRVEVKTYRANRPAVQVSSTSEAIGLFRLPGEVDENPLPYEQGPGAISQHVSSLGRDEELEQQLRQDILDKAQTE
jgi:hypothetical protein